MQNELEESNCIDINRCGKSYHKVSLTSHPILQPSTRTKNIICYVLCIPSWIELSCVLVWSIRINYIQVCSSVFDILHCFQYFQTDILSKIRVKV
jgi:hypothetical protein